MSYTEAENFDDPAFDGSSSQGDSGFSSQGEEQAGAPPQEVQPGQESDPNQWQQGDQQQAEDPYHEVPNIGKVPQSELYRGYLRLADYTRKTQMLGQRAREMEGWQQEKQAYDQSLAEIRAFLQDPSRMQAYLAALTGGQQAPGAPAAPPELDPNEILTAQQARTLFDRELSRRMTEQEERFNGQLRDQQVAAFRSQYSEAVDTKLSEIAGKYPELRQIPGMDMMLREAVRSRQPKTIQEALGLFEQAATFYVNKFDGIAKARIASNQGRTNPVNRGIEPPNGRPPMPRTASAQGDSFTGVRDPNLRNLVIQDINRIIQNQRGA